jgi:outer membrane lipoprotein-sorting protein
MAQQADLEGVLVDAKNKGHRVELLGTEKGAAGDLYRLRVTLKDGDADEYLIDARSWLPVRVESRRLVAGERVEGETTIGNYTEAGGWKWPRLIENRVKGREERQSIGFDKVEINPALDDARFKLPANAVPARRPGR